MDNKGKLRSLQEAYLKNIYKESPYIIKNLAKDWYYKLHTNAEGTEKIVKKMTKLPSISIMGVNIEVFQDPDTKFNRQDYFVNGYYTVATFVYKPFKEGIQFSLAWNAEQNKGYARRIVFDYYLKNYKFVLSDDLHTEFGRNYWKHLISEALQKGFKVEVLNTNFTIIGNITDVSTIDDWYSTDPSNSDSLFKITK